MFGKFSFFLLSSFLILNMVFACEDLCPQFLQTRCYDDLSGYSICTDVDGDGCFEWKDEFACKEGFICNNGTCVNYSGDFAPPAQDFSQKYSRGSSGGGSASSLEEGASGRSPTSIEDTETSGDISTRGEDGAFQHDFSFEEFFNSLWPFVFAAFILFLVLLILIRIFVRQSRISKIVIKGEEFFHNGDIVSARDCYRQGKNIYDLKGGSLKNYDSLMNLYNLIKNGVSLANLDEADNSLN